MKKLSWYHIRIMLMFKLSRVGKKGQAAFRVLVLDKRKDPWGTYLEKVGFYNPTSHPKVTEFNTERIKYWMSKGAQPTPTLHNLFVNAGILTGPKKKKHASKTNVTEATQAEVKK